MLCIVYDADRPELEVSVDCVFFVRTHADDPHDVRARADPLELQVAETWDYACWVVAQRYCQFNVVSVVAEGQFVLEDDVLAVNLAKATFFMTTAS